MRRQMQPNVSHLGDGSRTAGKPAACHRFRTRETWLPCGYRAIVRDNAGLEGLRLDPACESALAAYFAHSRRSPSFANARTARTLLERAREAQAARLAPVLEQRNVDLTELTVDDVAVALATMP
jgi:hypothetical protein